LSIPFTGYFWLIFQVFLVVIYWLALDPLNNEDRALSLLGATWLGIGMVIICGHLKEYIFQNDLIYQVKWCKVNIN
jgi:hypothetical protein